MKPKYLISIVGATAIGKTALSIHLAKYFRAEIISSDSRQFFKEMNIGTAVPSADELQQAKHYFIQNRSVFENYNVGDFERDALLKLDELFKSHQVVIMVGGSGLYVNAVLNGLDDFPDIDPKIRINIKSELEEKGLKSIQDQLKKLDLETYQKIDLYNTQRLIRALEICIGTGKAYSTFLNFNKKKRNFIPIKIGIMADREIIYNRINQRVDLMIQSGLLDEAKILHPYKNLNALQTVGYRELFQYFDGEISLEFAISEIKKNTRRFAKRQNTWFKKDNEIKWFNFREPETSIIEYADSLISKE